MRGQVGGRGLRGAAAGALLLLLAGTAGWAQEAGGESAMAARLGELTRAEQAALDAGDEAEILRTGRELGGLALRVMGDFEAGQERFGPAAEAYERSIAVGAAGEDGVATEVGTGLLLVTADVRAGRSSAAAEESARLVKAAGEGAQIHVLLANARHSGGDLPGTIAELERATALDAGFGAAHLELGGAYWELNEYQYNPDSLREFGAAQRASPRDFSANEDLGAVLSQYERYGEAEVCLRAAAAADPASPDPWLQLGMNAYAQGQREEAVRALGRAVALTGTDVARNGYQIRRAYAVLSRLAAEGGREEEARADGAKETELREAVERADAAIPLTESSGLVAQGPVQREFRRPEAAASASRAGAAAERTLAEVAAKGLNDAGTVLARRRDYAGALPLFRVAAAVDPELGPVLRNYGLAAFHGGDAGEAVSALERALAATPGDELVRKDLELAREQVRAGRPATATEPR